MRGPLLRDTLIGPYCSLCNLEIDLFVFQDELTSRVMEELRKKDRDSLLAEIQELRKTATKKPLFEQVKHEMEKVIFSLLLFFFFQLPLLADFTTYNYWMCSLPVKILAPAFLVSSISSRKMLTCVRKLIHRCRLSFILSSFLLLLCTCLKILRDGRQLNKMGHLSTFERFNLRCLWNLRYISIYHLNFLRKLEFCCVMASEFWC